MGSIFIADVWDILIRKSPNPELDQSEAWIMNLHTMASAEELAASVTSIDGMNVHCRAEEEPLNEWTLCSGNRDGWCKHKDECIYRHVTCKSGDACPDEECPFSHSSERKVVPYPRYRPAGYVFTHRIRSTYLTCRLSGPSLSNTVSKSMVFP